MSSTGSSQPTAAKHIDLGRVLTGAGRAFIDNIVPLLVATVQEPARRASAPAMFQTRTKPFSPAAASQRPSRASSRATMPVRAPAEVVSCRGSPPPRGRSKITPSRPAEISVLLSGVNASPVTAAVCPSRYCLKTGIPSDESRRYQSC